jgi:hypothetical protein
MLSRMGNEGWKVEHNERGELVATHQHESGEPVIAKLGKREDGVEFWRCECNAVFERGRGRGERATIS